MPLYAIAIVHTLGPTYMYGCNVNASKTWLITKNELYSEDVTTFTNTNVNISCEGQPHLGVALPTLTYREQFVIGKVEEWAKELKVLSVAGESQPHAALAAHTHGMTSYLAHTMPNISYHLQTLDTS